MNGQTTYSQCTASNLDEINGVFTQAGDSADLADTDGMEANAWALRKALRRIRIAWIMGILSGTITLLFALCAADGYYVEGYEYMSIWCLIDVFLIFGLSFGIWKKSRCCAILLFVYFVTSKLLMYSQSVTDTAAAFGALYCYLYFLGVLGTFSYHRLTKKTDIDSTATYMKGYIAGMNKARSDATTTRPVFAHELL